MKKYLFICSTAFIISACTGGEPLEQNYTVPSWTLFKRALQAGKSMTEASFLKNTIPAPKNRWIPHYRNMA